ncbi:MAG: glutathione S-transferase family protein [Ferrovibrio sp.]
MLTVHHLGVSQSERIVWLCEELGIPYALKIYKRAPVMAPADYKALHPIGSAPVITDDGITDDGLVLAESGAVVDYIIAKYGTEENGGARLALTKDHPDFASYLYWFHFANGTLQPALMRVLIGNRVDPDAAHPASKIGRDRMALCLGMMNARLADVPWLAGQDFTAADIMTVFCLTTMRHYLPYDLAPYPHIRAYLARVGARPAYRRAMEKGDPDMALLLD